MNDLNHVLAYLTGAVVFVAAATVVLYASVEARLARQRTREQGGRFREAPETPSREPGSYPGHGRHGAPSGVGFHAVELVDSPAPTERNPR